jgi:transcriptional regulator with XRE-family HTH domain
MRDNASKQYPYKLLGIRLKQLREKQRRSLAEVSGAVEIDVNQLNDIEQGSSRPSEDILILLANYFGLKDDETTALWEMAGYSGVHNHSDGKPEDISQQVLVMPLDVRIVYADLFHVALNDYGVMMNFMQSAGPNNQPLAVARLGMSREHAQKVLEVLERVLNPEKQESQKLLPAPENKPDSK